MKKIFWVLIGIILAGACSVSATCSTFAGDICYDDQDQKLHSSSTGVALTTMNSTSSIAINKLQTIHRIEALGRIRGQGNVECPLAWPSITAATAAGRGSATITGILCGSQLYFDINGTASIQPVTSGNMSSGTPAMNELRATGGAANQLAFIRTPTYVGSATSTLGEGIAMEVWLQTPNIGVATSSTEYYIGWSNIAGATDATTWNQIALPTDGCGITATSSANWKLRCRKNNVETLTDSGFASSTTAFKATLVMGRTGFSFYANDTLQATIASANLPATWMNGEIGVGNGATGAGIASPYLRVGPIKIWSQN